MDPGWLVTRTAVFSCVRMNKIRRGSALTEGHDGRLDQIAESVVLVYEDIECH